MHFIFIFLLHLLLFLLKIAAFLHYISCCPALIISLPSTVLASEHRSRASLILSKLEVVVDAHIMSNVLYIKIIGADEGKGPVLLLQHLNEVLYHLQIIFLAAVLLTILMMVTNTLSSSVIRALILAMPMPMAS